MYNLFLSLLMSLALATTAVSGIGGNLRNYQCSKCGAVVKSTSSPSSLNCCAGGSHWWRHLGHKGETAYQCKKCGIVVYSKYSPSSTGCPQGNSHNWTKLGR